MTPMTFHDQSRQTIYICIYMHLRLFHPHILDCCPGRRRPLHEVEVAAAVDQVHLNERAGVEHHKLARPIGVSPFLTIFIYLCTIESTMSAFGLFWGCLI